MRSRTNHSCASGSGAKRFGCRANKRARSEKRNRPNRIETGRRKTVAGPTFAPHLRAFASFVCMRDQRLGFRSVWGPAFVCTTINAVTVLERRIAGAVVAFSRCSPQNAYKLPHATRNRANRKLREILKSNSCVRNHTDPQTRAEHTNKRLHTKTRVIMFAITIADECSSVCVCVLCTRLRAPHVNIDRVVVSVGRRRQRRRQQKATRVGH